MKNIHILPTDNYSQLVNSTSKYGGLFLSKYYSPMKDMGDSYQNIYITSDVEIKVGDYCISHLNVIDEGKIHNTQTIFNPKTKEDLIALQSCKKIILTTDQDLIKDGVQAIDDTFLEWFVKNPSCEKVEVVKYDGYLHFKYMIIIPQEEPKIMHNCPKCGLDLVEREGSKPVCTRIDCGGIIISNETLREWALKEEPKQDLEKEMFELEQELDIPSSMRWHNSKPKQEIKLEDIFNDEKKQGVKDLIDAHKQETTLEEVAKWSLEKAKEFALERFKSDRKKAIVTWDSILEVLKVGVKTGHKFGTKHQAERMYSEEDMRGMYDKSCGLIGLSLLNDQTENDSRFKKLLEQFKKK